MKQLLIHDFNETSEGDQYVRVNQTAEERTITFSFTVDPDLLMSFKKVIAMFVDVKFYNYLNKPENEILPMSDKHKEQYYNFMSETIKEFPDTPLALQIVLFSFNDKGFFDRRMISSLLRLVSKFNIMNTKNCTDLERIKAIEFLQYFNPFLSTKRNMFYQIKEV